MTSLNIGLRGSYASRLPGKWAKFAVNYPSRRLYLNLTSDAAENEQGVIHDLRLFVEPPPTGVAGEVHWFPVSNILQPKTNMGTLHKYLVQYGLGNDERPYEILEKLWEAVYHKPLINFYQEDDQDIDRVLDIFIRVNSAGTVLSYSDLLLSIATAQWNALDARDEIHGLVDELNAMGQGFAFDKDVVLKAGLVLTEVSDVGFKVTNFNRKNMAKLEAEWSSVEDSLRLAAGLLADFGFSAATLTANSVLIPIAYYVHHRKLTEQYRHGAAQSADRRLLRTWTVKSLIKPGIWGSGLDTLLRELRNAIKDYGMTGFPFAEIEAAMVSRGKPLSFTDAERAEVVETRYGEKRVFPLLALLFPNVDTKNLFHIDHIYPKKLFKPTALVDAGVATADVDRYRDMLNGLPNLQLLEGPENLEKQGARPLGWATHRYGPGLENYMLTHDLLSLTDDVAQFEVFYEKRRDRLAARLVELLGTAANPPDAQPAGNGPTAELSVK